MTDPTDLPDHGGSRSVAKDWTSERRRLYAVLLQEGLDEESLNHLLAAKGAALLDTSVPYLVVAARNQVRSTQRRERRRREVEATATGRVPRPATLDPADVVIAKVELGAVVEALGQLDPGYSWPLWWHAAGFTDEEIILMWDDAGFQPSTPSKETVRKRRERARKHLRGAVDAVDAVDEER